MKFRIPSFVRKRYTNEGICNKYLRTYFRISINSRNRIQAINNPAMQVLNLRSLFAIFRNSRSCLMENSPLNKGKTNLVSARLGASR